MDQQIVIVNDGQQSWGVDASKLLSALHALGWTRDGDLWIEGSEDSYMALCSVLDPAPGYEPENVSDDWHDLPEFAYLPARGGWSRWAE